MNSFDDTCCTAGITNSNMNPDAISVLVENEQSKSGLDIGALQNFVGIFGLHEHFVGDLPKIVSGEPQKNGRERQNDSEPSNQLMFVAAQEEDKPSQSRTEDDSVKKGTVILFTALIGCGLVYWAG